MKRLLLLCCLTTSLIFTPVLYAQTTPPVLTLTQQAFVKALCITVATDPDTPGAILPPGMTADQFGDACVVAAFYIANDKDLRDKFNVLTGIVISHGTRLDILEAATPPDVTALQAQVASLEAALAAVTLALTTP